MDTERPGVAAGAFPETIVIVGAGQAGGWAAQTLRKEGFGGRIVLIGEESHPPHERPPLSKAVLAGDALPETTRLMKSEAFEGLGLEWRPGVCATRIDRAAKRLHLADGEAVAYDKLILCTGGRARRLTIPGADSDGVHTLRTIGDALALAPVLKPGNSVVVVGGGWIGLEVAARRHGRRAPTSSSWRRKVGCASARCRRRSPAPVYCIGRRESGSSSAPA
jgi:3-phenylpropionate/trans-cinnamate dioxygenase ferredoxin reductase subunit